jgi:cystathionine beta-lyase
VLRGIRTLEVRLKMHEQHALSVAQWLDSHPKIHRVFCPALKAEPGHSLWLRDCSGTNGLLSFEMAGATMAQAEKMLDSLCLFGLGASWGGYESLASIADISNGRVVADWSQHGPIIRLHIGLEDPQDLIDDLQQALEIAYLPPAV